MPRKAKNNIVLPPSANPLAVCTALRIPPATYFAAMAKFAQTIQAATADFDRLAGTDSQRQSALRAHVASQIGNFLHGGEDEATQAPKPRAKAGRKPKAVAAPKPKAKAGRKPKAAKSESAAGGSAGRRPNGPEGKGVKQIVSDILQNANSPMTTDAIEGLVRERYDAAGVKVPASIGGQIGTALSALRKDDQISAESAGDGRRKQYAWTGAAVAA